MARFGSVVSLSALGFIVAACTADLVTRDENIDSVSEAITLTQVTSFGSNPGNLVMYKFVPGGLPTGKPLVVVLHGCTQSATEYATRTEWENLANRYQFAIAYAEQQTANHSNKCFNWYQTADITRGQGEALSIKQMVDKMKTDHGSDASRIYVTGLSAGGYMTTVMLATYPEVFAGGAIMAGGPYKCATTLTEASPCQQGLDKTPAQWGDLVRGQNPGYTGPWPKVTIFHGTSDYTVYPKNMTEAMEQWTNVLGIDQTADFTETFRGHTHSVYKNAGGTPLVETWSIASMGHGITVDLGTATDQGGATGAYSEDRNVYSSYYSALFLGLTGSGGDAGVPDTTPPTVNVTAPTNGSTVSGTIAVDVTASDNVGVTKVELWVDSVLKGTDTTAPYSFALDTTTLTNAAHAISARAYDAANNVGIDNDTTVTVSNASAPPPTALIETFSGASGPDNASFSVGTFALDATKDATGTAGSKSILGSAASNFNTVTKTATWSTLALGAAPVLSYKRQLSMSDANTSASSAFRVIVNDGTDHVVDEKALSGLVSYSETAWTARTGINLSAYANKTVTVKFVVTVKDLSSVVTTAKAWVDDVQIQ
jgi:poly(hydroxyalkanoate) depolymerase family esterase